MQYILKYESFFVYILSYYTYSGTEYLDIHFIDISWVLVGIYC